MKRMEMENDMREVEMEVENDMKRMEMEVENDMKGVESEVENDMEVGAGQKEEMEVEWEKEEAKYLE